MRVGKLAARAVVVAFLLTAGLSMGLASNARAAQVLVLGRGGHVGVRVDRYAPASDPLAPTPAATESAPRSGAARARVVSAGPSVLAALQGLYSQGQISSATYSADRNAWNAALTAHTSLTGTPAVELGAVIANVNQIASSGLLTPSRLAEVFLTVNDQDQAVIS